jgi:N-acetylmuramic acid 6-phosphate etherase
MKKTESNSSYNFLEKMSVNDLLLNINKEDKKVAQAIEKAIPQIEKLVIALIKKIANGGRLFYLGAGTSGRLAVVDSSECPPTFGVNPDLVIAIIAGGDKALRTAVESAEDNFDAGWHELIKKNISINDFVIGISSSGTTPFVIGALQMCMYKGITTGAITSNPNSLIIHEADYPIVIDTGSEFITGSTRMKSGSAQKMVLNMISTSLMIKLGKVMDNKMVDMKLTNKKLIDRAARMITDIFEMPYQQSKELVINYGSVRAVIEKLKDT